MGGGSFFALGTRSKINGLNHGCAGIGRGVGVCVAKCVARYGENSNIYLISWKWKIRRDRVEMDVIL